MCWIRHAPVSACQMCKYTHTGDRIPCFLKKKGKNLQLTFTNCSGWDQRYEHERKKDEKVKTSSNSQFFFFMVVEHRARPAVTIGPRRVLEPVILIIEQTPRTRLYGVRSNSCSADTRFYKRFSGRSSFAHILLGHGCIAPNLLRFSRVDFRHLFCNEKGDKENLPSGVANTLLATRQKTRTAIQKGYVKACIVCCDAFFCCIQSFLQRQRRIEFFLEPKPLFFRKKRHFFH